MPGSTFVANDGLAIGHQGQEQGFGGIFRRQEDLFFHPAMMTGVADFSTRTCGRAETAATACRAWKKRRGLYVDSDRPKGAKNGVSPIRSRASTAKIY